ncbi:dihydrodipicolinate reductase [Litorivivens sp.]|uniref:dihydrodipicolinate reductase n=1 Tax=Litorivivens sp. TaxID=2020868 RepID=UPI0035628400
MPYRIIHCGTGNVGAHALRSIIGNPELELVGHYVSTPDKAGKDSGELLGVEATGVIATNNWADLYDLKADCLTYFGNTIAREKEAINDLPPFLERGVNVISFAHFSLAHAATTPADEREIIEAACRKGNSSCFFTGMDPGWATTDLTIAALAVADKIDCVRVCELGYMGTYDADFVMREYFGFGQQPGFEPLFVSGGFLQQMWSPTTKKLAEILDVEIHDHKLTYETACLDHDIEAGIGTVKAGTAVVVRFEFQALHNGKPFIIVEHVDSITKDPIDKDWKTPHGPTEMAYRIEIEGSPKFAVELGLEEDAATLAAMPVINSIAAVCGARPGLLDPLDIPRYWSKRVRTAQET